MRSIIETLIGLVVTVAFTVFVFATMLTLLNFTGRYACLKHGETTGQVAKWVHYDACYVRDNGRWVQRGER